MRKARETAGLDQREIADLIAISRQTVGNYETGLTPPRIIVLRAWARACDVEEDWLIDDYVQPSRKPRGMSITTRLAANTTGQYLAWIPKLIRGGGRQTGHRARLRAVA